MMMAAAFRASLCWLAFSLAGALEVTIPKDLYEFARGDNITLPCQFKPKSPAPKLVIVSWTVDGVDPDGPEKMVLTHYSTGITDVPPLYEKRASLDADIAKGKANLKLNTITLRDSKVFECRVQIPGDDEGTLAATTRLVVLVAPSKPVCKVQGKAEYGQNINLTCLSAEGSPTPEYSWEQRDVRNNPRRPEARTTDKGGILSLYNVSMETSGYYICTSANKIRAATCNLTLTVSPPSMNMGATAGFIAAGVGALLILAIVIYCCCCRKKKEKEEEYAMGTPAEGELHEKEAMANVERDDQDRHDDRAEDDRRSDYTNRRDDDDYDDRRSDYTNRRDDDRRYDDRAERRRDDDDRRSDYTNRRDDDDRRSDDRAERRRDDDRYDEPYEERARAKPPSLPSSKPPQPRHHD